MSSEIHPSMYHPLLSITPSFLVYKARADTTRSPKLYFDHYFLLYYFIYGYE
jgi:hypothetical protein